MSTARYMFAAMLICLSACSQKQTDALDSPIDGGTESAWSVRDTMPAPAPLGVVFGSSFGECSGYCWHEFTLHKWGIVGVRKAGPLENAQKPDQTIWARLAPEQISLLLAELDTMELGAPYEAIGCGDCKDGGACWLRVERPERTKVLSYECVGGAGHLHSLVEHLWRLDPSPPENVSGLLMPGLPRWE